MADDGYTVGRLLAGRVRLSLRIAIQHGMRDGESVMSKVSRSSGPINEDSQVVEEPQFEEVVIFYNFVFDLGDSVNPTDAARRLLDREFALCAANYLTDDIEVAIRFRELLYMRSRARDVSEIDRDVNATGLRGLIGWVLRHPIRSWRLWRMMRQARSSSDEGKNKDQGGEVEEEDVQVGMKDVVESFDEAMTRIQLFEALQRHVDRTLFTPQYLREIPFARIGLQPFYATIAGERIAVDVGLLVHRTGVAILTFYVMFDGQKSVDELINLQLATQVQLECSEVVRAIVVPSARGFGLQSSDLDKAPFERRYSSGVEWLVYRDQRDATLAGVFELYQTAIISAIRKRQVSNPAEPWSWLRTPDWFVYPIVFVRRITPAVFSGDAFRDRYPECLAGLVTRFRGWRTMREEAVQEAIEADLSIIGDYSLHVGASHATVLYYERRRRALIERHGEDIPGQEWLSAHFQASSVIDVLLIQRWILFILNCQLRSISYNLRKLNALKRDFLLALEEYHGIMLSYGSAQDIVRKAKKTMGITEMYQSSMQKLGMMERLIEVEETRRRTHHDRLLRTGAILATLLFGLSSAWQVVEVVGSWGKLPPEAWWVLDTPVLKSVVQFVQERPVPVALLLYFVLISIVIPIIIWGFFSPRKRKAILDIDQSKPARTPGFTWPVSVMIAPRRDNDDHKHAREAE